MYDYLIVGSGLFGAVFAHEATKAGKKCIILEKRGHIGGNCYTEEIEGISVHMYGAHIFHTADRKIWDYISQFAEFNHYINSPIANYKGEIYNLPFNMNTFSKMWGINTPSQARDIIEHQRGTYEGEPQNLEQQALSLVGKDIYEKLIKGYTEKQWGRPCDKLPASIIKRLPMRFIYDNNYFNDPYQGIPKEGYTAIIKQMLTGCEVRLNTDYNTNKDTYRKLAKKVVYTGMLDSYFNFCFGPLEYRSLRFETEILEVENYQGVAVVNYTDAETPYTRIIEHKHFVFGTQPKTVISREYPREWENGTEPYYPINDEKNQLRYEQYISLALQEQGVFFGGRLGQYRYYDMKDTISAALEMVQAEI